VNQKKTIGEELEVNRVDREDKGMVIFSIIMWVIIIAWAAFAP